MLVKVFSSCTVICISFNFSVFLRMRWKLWYCETLKPMCYPEVMVCIEVFSQCIIYCKNCGSCFSLSSSVHCSLLTLLFWTPHFSNGHVENGVFGHDTYKLS